MHVITLHIKASLNEAGHIYNIQCGLSVELDPNESINCYWLVIPIVIMFVIYRITL